MKIESLQVQVASQRNASERTIAQTTINRTPPPAPIQPPAPAIATTATAASATLSSTQVNLSPEAVAAADNEQSLENDPRYAAVKALYEQITGLAFDDSRIELKQTTSNAQLPARPPVGEITITHREVRSESEQTQFSAQGQVTTRDGKKIAFDFQLNLQRSQSEESSLTVRFGPKVKDPLVLNFGGKGGQNSARLTDTKFNFDLNGDGQQEAISFLAGNSGFLALDKNADGVINNGKELFGPGTDDGFAELAAFDADHNQVIDENDPVFSRLRIFNKDASGQDQLATLAEKGVGAVLLAHANTRFDLKDGQNQLQGKLRASGVYLSENGGVGSVQQIDLRV